MVESTKKGRERSESPFEVKLRISRDLDLHLFSEKYEASLFDAVTRCKLEESKDMNQEIAGNAMNIRTAIEVLTKTYHIN